MSTLVLREVPQASESPFLEELSGALCCLFIALFCGIVLLSYNPSWVQAPDTCDTKTENSRDLRWSSPSIMKVCFIVAFIFLCLLASISL